MKRVIRHYIIETLSLYLVSNIALGMVFEEPTQTLLIAGAGLMAANFFAKPIINILLLPLNLVTFGFFRWVASAIALYLVTLIVPGFKVAFFELPQYTSRWIDIPNMRFEGVLAFIAFAFIMSLITSFMFWLNK
jgi:putative membrane protein